MVRSDWPTCSEVVDVVDTGRLDRFQRKHHWAGFPLAVAYKYFDDFGAYLAALLTYYGFVSLFPLLLLLSTILGFVLAGDPRLQHEVLTSAVHQFPVIGGDLARPKRLGGGPIGLVVGDRGISLRRAGSGASLPVCE
jgi:membrane protein